MKKLLICIVLMIAPLLVKAQVTSPYSEQFRAFDTNGPMGECLFPITDDGDVIYQEIIESSFSKSELKKKAIKFFR